MFNTINKKMKKNKIKKKSKAKFYTIFHVFIVIILFFLLDLWSVGHIENYSKIYEFKKNIRNGSYKIDKFPPTELSGIKLFDDFEKYFFNDKEHYQYLNHKTYWKINNYKYRFTSGVYLMHAITAVGKEINPSDLLENDSLIKNPSSDKFILADENNDEIKLIIEYPDLISLDNNKTILNICDNSRNQVLKKNNLSKSDFKRKYYKEEDNDGEFFDTLSFDYTINNKNGEIIEPKKVNLSLMCGYNKSKRDIDYQFGIILSEIKAFDDFLAELGLVETKMNVKEMIKKIK